MDYHRLALKIRIWGGFRRRLVDCFNAVTIIEVFIYTVDISSRPSDIPRDTLSLWRVWIISCMIEVLEWFRCDITTLESMVHLQDGRVDAPNAFIGKHLIYYWKRAALQDRILYRSRFHLLAYQYWWHAKTLSLRYNQDQDHLSHWCYFSIVVLCGRCMVCPFKAEWFVSEWTWQRSHG